MFLISPIFRLWVQFPMIIYGANDFQTLIDSSLYLMSFLDVQTNQLSLCSPQDSINSLVSIISLVLLQYFVKFQCCSATYLSDWKNMFIANEQIWAECCTLSKALVMYLGMKLVQKLHFSPFQQGLHFNRAPCLITVLS